MIDTITWDEFEKVELRTGTIVDVDDFPQAKKPAYIIKADFGDEIGVLQTSARVTELYTKDELKGKQIIGVVNFPEKRIGPVTSQFLLTGFYRDADSVVLAVPDKDVPNGAKLG